MFSEKDVFRNKPPTFISFERGILEQIKAMEELDIHGEHKQLFKEIKSVVSNYFTTKGE